MAQDYPDLPATARALSQHVSDPVQGTYMCLKWAIRHLPSQPRGMLTFPGGKSEEALRIWTESDWVGDASWRRSCSGRHIQRKGGTICHWSTTKGNVVAMPSGESTRSQKGSE